MRINTQKVTTLLDGFSSSIKTPPLLEDGNLDVQKLQLLPETITLVENLKREGLKTSEDLRVLGFAIAFMLLRF